MPPRKKRDPNTGKIPPLGLPKGWTRLNGKRIPVLHKILELVYRLVITTERVYDDLCKLRKETAELRKETQANTVLLQQILQKLTEKL